MIESPGILYRGAKSGEVEFTDFINKVKTLDFKEEESMHWIESAMELDGFVEYLAVQIFIANTDWPQNNWIIWKSTDENSKWKWILKDTDYGWAFYHEDAWKFQMKHRLDISNSFPAYLYRALLVNKSFKSKLKDKMNDLLHDGFSEEKINTQINELTNNLEPEMANQINRWRTHISVKSWKDEINLIEQFSELRRNYLKENLLD